MNDNIIFETPEKKRKEFENAFFNIVEPYIATYKTGTSPLMWYSEKEKPIIPEDFSNHLPKVIQERVKNLIFNMFE
jgi:hypothetical protein